MSLGCTRSVHAVYTPKFTSREDLKNPSSRVGDRIIRMLGCTPSCPGRAHCPHQAGEQLCPNAEEARELIRGFSAWFSVCLPSLRGESSRQCPLRFPSRRCRHTGRGGALPSTSPPSQTVFLSLSESRGFEFSFSLVRVHLLTHLEERLHLRERNEEGDQTPKPKVYLPFPELRLRAHTVPTLERPPHLQRCLPSRRAQASSRSPVEGPHPQEEIF
ncbi:uncharacterized protein LOC119001237 [Sturnira hondurensis]|uniref:uncharacterized protein LOC119001237 n=1 Tax=Sturnira hondurensis TaxID=192404 RepID=UPI00187A568F|nr:uncharacterized protein LOC119001237 [Sturnira hondurensis]